jgi:hypothetical protein
MTWAISKKKLRKAAVKPDIHGSRGLIQLSWNLIKDPVAYKNCFHLDKHETRRFIHKHGFDLRQTFIYLSLFFYRRQLMAFTENKNA